MTAISIVKWFLLIAISIIFILICIYQFKEYNYIKKQEIQIYKGSIKYIQTIESNSEFINDYFPKWFRLIDLPISRGDKIKLDQVVEGYKKSNAYKNWGDLDFHKIKIGPNGNVYVFQGIRDVKDVVGVWASSSTEIKLYFSDSDKVFQKFRSKNPFIAFPIEEKSYPFSFRLGMSVLLKQLNKPNTRVNDISLFTRNYFFDLVDYQICESIIVSPGDRLFPSSYL